MSYASIVKNTDMVHTNATAHESNRASDSVTTVNSYESTIYTEARFYPLVPLPDIQEKQRTYLNKKMGIVPVKTRPPTKNNQMSEQKPSHIQAQPQPSLRPHLVSPTNSNLTEITAETETTVETTETEPKTTIIAATPSETQYKVVDALDVKEIMRNINAMTSESPYGLVLKNQQLEIKKNMEQIENYQTFIKTQSELISKQEKTLGELRRKVNKNNLIVENNEKTITEQTTYIYSYNKQITELKLQYTSILTTNQTLQQQNIALTHQIQQYQQHLTVIEQQLASQYTLLQQLQQTPQPQPQPQLYQQLQPQPQMVYPQQHVQQLPQYQQQSQYLTPEMSVAIAHAMAQMMTTVNTQ
jgi:hypothetical protein